MPRVLLRLRFGGADGFLRGEPPAVSSAVQVLFQLPQRGLVRLLRAAGAVVVESNGQLLKGHANLVRLADPVVASHQIQLSGRQHLLHPLHQQRPAHQAVIGNSRITAAADDLLSRLEQFSASSPEWLSGYLHEQLFRAVTDADSLLRSLSSRAMAWLGSAAAALPGGVLAIATGVLAIFFTSASYPELCAALEHAVPEEAMAKLRLFRGGVMRSLARWLRAQATLSLITFSEILIGFLLMRQSYSLLLAFLITLLDALPVFGTGTALVPWAVFTLLFGFPPKAIVLLALYLCTLITRNTLEPKLLSAQAGLPPVASLFAMYLGYCTFGVAGMVLFPFLLLLFAQIRNAKAEAAA